MPVRLPDVPPEQSLALMPSFLAHYIEDDAARARVAAALESVETTPAEWGDLLEVIGAMGQDYGRQPSHPLAGRLARAYLEALLTEGSTIAHPERLHTDGPTLIVANHLGYTDTLALRELLIRSGRSDLGDRIGAVAGPKVYEDALRLFAVASHPSIRVAQSTQVTNGADVRQLLRITKRCLADCATMLAEGQLIVLFAEGTRSRNARFQPFIKAVARWVAQPGLTVVPVAHWGSEDLYAVDGDRLGPAEVHAAVGEPIDVDTLRQSRSKTEVLEAIHVAVDELLPPEYRSEGPRLR